MSALGRVYFQQQTIPDPVGNSRLGQKGTFASGPPPVLLVGPIVGIYPGPYS
jgi:hypothetical protein